MSDVRIAVDAPTPELLAVGVGPAGLSLDAVPTRVLPLAARSLVEAFVAENDPSAKPGSVASLPLPGELPNRGLVAGIGGGTAGELRLAGATIGRAGRAGAA